MTWHELPFVFGLLACMMPCGMVVYGLPGLLLKKGLITPLWCRPLLHIGSVLYWLLGWGVFMKFYQCEIVFFMHDKSLMSFKFVAIEVNSDPVSMK